jgi:hypothetical protein
MSRPRPKSRILLDWFTVSYRNLVLVLVLLGAMAGFGAWWVFIAPSDVAREAGEAVARAEERLAEAATYPSEPKVDEYRSGARAALADARQRIDARRWEDARVAALRSENLSQQAIDLSRGDRGAEQEVRLYRWEGDVRIKRAGEFSWEVPDRKKNVRLRVGDQVKTAGSASAQIMYFDGTITTIESGSLLEIRHVSEDPATKVRRVEEKLNWGEVLASTRKRNVAGSYHQVSAENASAKSEDGARFRFAVDKETQSAEVAVFGGELNVQSRDRVETVLGGERIRATSDGRLTPKEMLPGVPRLVSPSDEKLFLYEDPSRATTTLSWEKVPGAGRYRLQISDEFLFSNLLYAADRAETNVVIDGVADGEYFWRVAAVASSGVAGEYSPARRFRVSAQRIRDRRDKEPPALEITEKVQTGAMLILNGRTEPGALLWVDDEKVEVADDGSFYAVIRLKREGVNEIVVSAQDAAGNVTRMPQTAYVETY